MLQFVNVSKTVVRAKYDLYLSRFRLRMNRPTGSRLSFKHRRVTHIPLRGSARKSVVQAKVQAYQWQSSEERMRKRSIKRGE